MNKTSRLRFSAASDAFTTVLVLYIVVGGVGSTAGIPVEADDEYVVVPAVEEEEISFEGLITGALFAETLLLEVLCVPCSLFVE